MAGRNRGGHGGWVPAAAQRARGQHRLGPGAVAHVPSLDAGRGALFMAQMLGDLLVQGGFQHGLGQLLQQPIRPGQGQALLPRPAHQLGRGRLLSGRLRPLLLCSHIIQCRGHHGTFPARPSSPARSGRKHRCGDSPPLTSAYALRAAFLGPPPSAMRPCALPRRPEPKWPPGPCRMRGLTPRPYSPEPRLGLVR